MFKSLAKDLSGTADICNTVTNFSKLAGAQYVLPKEEILFAFQSAKEEFVFTDQALITVCGENATTTRRLVLRYEYRENPLTKVQFETTGRVDRDCEIKFQIGEYSIFIDIAKKEEELVKTHYKALVALSREQHERLHNWELAKQGLDRAADALHLKDPRPEAMSLTSQASQALQWLEDDFAKLNPRSYKSVVVPALSVSSGRRK
ncbi:P-loop containing nucleoside triphosphate hydrolase [Globisporangium polare]